MLLIAEKMLCKCTCIQEAMPFTYTSQRPKVKNVKKQTNRKNNSKEES